MLLRNSLFVLGLLTLIAGLTLAVFWMRLPQAASLSSAPAAGQQQAVAAAPAVLVAARDIPQGTLLRGDQLAWKEMPAAQLRSNWLLRGQVDSGLYAGAVTKRAFAAQEPLVNDEVVRPGDRNFLAAVLAPGMRALALTVDFSQDVAGLLQPGDHVDVLLAQSFGFNPAQKSVVGETVLSNVRVVAVDQWFNPDTKPNGAVSTQTRVSRTVTLETSEIDAKRIIVASQLGRVTLALHALDGGYDGSAQVTAASQPVWAKDISSALPGEAKKTSAASPGQTAAVRIIRGSKIETP